MRPLLALPLALLACGGGSAPPDAPPFDECPVAAALCLDEATTRVCVATGDGLRWRDQACPAQSGCVAGACVSGECSDACAHGDTNGALTCRAVDARTGLPVTLDPAGSLHDRARAYETWLRRDGMVAGGIGSARYADPPAYTDVVALDGVGDSAIWTGTYLAAEALRLQVTGAADARASVGRLVETLHAWMNVSGSPGLLVRFAAPSGASTTWPVEVGDLDCLSTRCHCGVSYDGGSWDVIGHTGRDQYQGVILGYALAYQALGPAEEATRELIRDDVVELVEELMTERSLPLLLTFDGVPFPETTVRLRFVVLAESEMVGGAVALEIDSSSLESSAIHGAVEFIPDLADVVRQVPLLAWAPPLPRAGSGIMLASFFRVALLVTDGVPAYAARRAAIADYYTGHTGAGGHVDDWLDVADTYAATTPCGDAYYVHNVAMEPMYGLARLEDDAARGPRVDGILAARMWPLFATTKNSFFSFIYAATVPGVDAAVAAEALAQLAQFPPPPRVRRPVDLRANSKYPDHEAGCTDQVSHATAVDVGDRPAGDFLWQRHPWGLYDPGDLAQTQPGVDFLVAYWMARRHGFAPDDAAGRCLAWW